VAVKILVPVILSACACGGGHEWAPIQTSDAAAYRDLALRISDAAGRHRANDTNIADASSCRSEHSRYDAEVRPLLDRMSAMSGKMDSWMRCTGAGLAEMEEGCQSMRAELDRHALAGCSTNSLVNLGEVNRHYVVMADWAQREADDASRMMGTESCANMISCGSCGH
jgi:hypothetical protein